jgi:hypothetical protein
MFFLIDESLKIIFGWSAKCGCSHIKKIFWYMKTGNDNHEIHIIIECNSLPTDIENYTTILIIRNPFERIISGFLDKYSVNGELRKHWKYNTITFSKFVDELLINDWKMIDKHHFTPQTTESFDSEIIHKSKELKVYDIKNIDYNYIEELYSKKIPEKLLNFKGTNTRKIKSQIMEDYVFNLDMSLYYDYNIDIKYFYNDIIKKKIFNFYKNDFIFFTPFYISNADYL